jgi:Skp family chaperone for outer membrane proteins
MADRDLGQSLENLENLKDKGFRIAGIRMTPASVMGLLALLGSVFAALYGGFITYQKVEALAELDLDSIAAQMAKTSEDVERIKEDAQTIKDDLKDDIRDVKDKIDYVESKVDKRLQAFDEKLLGLETKVDTKMTRFEEKVEKTSKDFEDKLQKALDNPLAN